METYLQRAGRLCAEVDADACIRSISFSEDGTDMNWVEGTHRLGETVRPQGLGVRRTVQVSGDFLEMHFTFYNDTDSEFFLRRGQAGIWVPFNDSYGQASLCMTNRCHAHVWCGENSSYVMGLRMGGMAPHLGMVLVQGSLTDYSVERGNKSNDRGDLLLHLSSCRLKKGEELAVTLRFFAHTGREDFLGQIRKTDGYIHVTAEHFTCFEGEPITLRAEVSEQIDTAEVLCGDRSVPFKVDENALTVCENADSLGSRVYHFQINGKRTHCRVFVSEDFETVMEKRCHFLVNKQQLIDPESPLDGAFLIYDQEEDCLVYERGTRDHNAARERICMGILLAQFLKKHPDVALKERLDRFVAFHLREICDLREGIVCNDVGYENTKLRLYNYPWTVRFFLDLFDLEGDQKWLSNAVKVMRKYYEQNGENFYAFTIPVYRLGKTLRANGMEQEAEELLAWHRRHAAVMIERASNYPAHEVSYEQSIVAPAADFLMQMYRLTGEAFYLEHAHGQMLTASLFTGTQPDHRMHMCAIRHWDGFWFGKRRLYGDTFPHYWNVLSANAFYEYGSLIGNADCLRAAEEAYRGQLCQFTPDGGATCAILTPLRVNGQTGDYRDPWANDQDWALVYYADYLNENP